MILIVTKVNFFTRFFIHNRKQFFMPAHLVASIGC